MQTPSTNKLGGSGNKFHERLNQLLLFAITQSHAPLRTPSLNFIQVLWEAISKDSSLRKTWNNCIKRRICISQHFIGNARPHISIKINSKGTRTVQWGTPGLTRQLGVKDPFTTTHSCLSDEKWKINLIYLKVPYRWFQMKNHILMIVSIIYCTKL